MKHTKKVLAILTVLAVVMVMAGSVWAGDSNKININTASAEELVQLKRIGPAYAAKIIEFREANGPFQAPEDIMKVPGIGSKTFELNKDRITVM